MAANAERYPIFHQRWTHLAMVCAILAGLLSLAPQFTATAEAQRLPGDANNCSGALGYPWFEGEIHQHKNVGGLHILRDSAFKYQPRYKSTDNYLGHSFRDEALAISNKVIRQCGWSKSRMLGSFAKQQEYLCNNNLDNSLDRQRNNSEEALKAGGVPTHVAKELANRAHNFAVAWRGYNSIFPSRVPGCSSPQMSNSTCYVWDLNGVRHEARLSVKHTPSGSAGKMEMNYFYSDHDVQAVRVQLHSNVSQRGTKLWDSTNLASGKLHRGSFTSGPAQVARVLNPTGQKSPRYIWDYISATVVFDQQPDVKCTMFISPGWTETSIRNFETNGATNSFDASLFDSETLESEGTSGTVSTSSPTPSSTPTPSSGWRLVKVDGSSNGDGFVLFGDGTRTWVSPTCRTQLQNNGRNFETVQWNVISPNTQVSNKPTCNQIASNTTGGSATQPPAPTSSIEFVAMQGYDDAWIISGDGTRQWISGQCRSQLTDRKGAPRMVEWNAVLRDRPDIGTRLSCDQIEQRL